MANNGMMQAKVSIPSTYQMAITEIGGGGGPITVDVYTSSTTGYWSSGTTLLTTLGDALTNDATLAGTYTASISTTTGKVTLSVTGITSFTITWTTTALRDLLGFSGSEVGTTSYTGDNAAKAIWIPNCPVELPFDIGDDGWYEYDASVTEAPDGTTVSTAYNRRTAQTLTWVAVLAARARTYNESVTNESYQTFYDDCIYGAQAWATTGGPVRWFPDRDVAGTSTEYKIPTEQRTSVARLEQNWSGLYTITIPRLVKVPA